MRRFWPLPNAISRCVDMEAAKNPNRCIVEDGDTWAAVIGLMRHHMPSWPSEGAERAPVYVQVDNQITKQLKLPVLKAEFQASNRKALGIVVDAETNISSVWQRLLPFLKQTFANFTGYLPTEGLVLEDNDGRRFGIWV